MTFRRALSLLLVFILLAAALNVPVAVTMLRSRTQPKGNFVLNVVSDEAAARGWPRVTPHPTPWPAPTQWTEKGAFGYRNITVWSAHTSTGFQMVLELIGWPLPALERMEMWWPWNDPNWALAIEPDPPLRLHWRGVLLNPLILGGGAWALFVLPVALFTQAKHRFRVRRRQCPACGCPASQSDRCTECGLVLPTSIVHARVD